MTVAAVIVFRRVGYGVFAADPVASGDDAEDCASVVVFSAAVWAVDGDAGAVDVEDGGGGVLPKGHACLRWLVFAFRAGR